MIKKISKWAVIIPIEVVGWVMWPVAKAHKLLKQLLDWIKHKLS